MFEVFNVKVKLLHDSSSYQTIRRQVLFFLVIANAISSLCNYRKGAAKTEPAPVRKQNKEEENKNNSFFHFFSSADLKTLSMPLSVMVSSCLFYSVDLSVHGYKGNSTRGDDRYMVSIELSFKNVSIGG